MRKRASQPQQDSNPQSVTSSAPLTASELPALSPEVAELIQQALAKVHFGTVQIIVQDGRVVQIDTTIKTRLT